MISLQVQTGFIRHVSVVTFLRHSVIYIHGWRITEINTPFILTGSHWEYIKRSWGKTCNKLPAFYTLHDSIRLQRPRTTPRHYLNQYWLFIDEAFWSFAESNCTETILDHSLQSIWKWHVVENIATLRGGQWVNTIMQLQWYKLIEPIPLHAQIHIQRKYSIMC